MFITLTHTADNGSFKERRVINTAHVSGFRPVMSGGVEVGTSVLFSNNSTLYVIEKLDEIVALINSK